MALVQVQETPRWKKLLSYVGPGFLVSVAYLDPGNLETDLQAGADHKYELLWIVLVGLIFALIVQSRSVNLGVATGKHLAEHCKMEYPAPVKYCLWILAEVAVIAADIPEVIGTAFALNILLHIPIWGGVLLAGLNTLLLLGLQRYGIRKLEIVIASLIVVVGSCFFSVVVSARPNLKEMMAGMFIPKLNGTNATRDAVALLGALIMPHNLFLHSALVISRKLPHSSEAIRSACKYFFIESAVSLLLAFAINVAVISVTASVCSDQAISPETNSHCRDVTLASASYLLKNALGNWSSKLYAISLLASGQSSVVTGTYAGQFIMEGFLDLKMELWLRNLLTRVAAVAPSLILSIIAGPSGAARLIIIASMILAFELPFALVPLLKFTDSEAKMGLHKNSLTVTIISWLLGFASIAINLYFLSTSVIGLMTSNRLPKPLLILTELVVFPVMILYIALLLYLTTKKVVPPTMDSTELEIYTSSSDRTMPPPERVTTLSNTQHPNEIEMGEGDIVLA